jgi:glutaminyl-peptide cyclotransferase
MRNSSVLASAAFIIVVSFLTCCKKENPKDKIEKEQTATVPAPVFNEDSSYKYVADQVRFGPRVPNSVAHFKCGDYLINKLKQSGATVTVQSFEAKAFDGTKLNLRNITGSINPKAPIRIILAAHWDTRPFADQDKEFKDKPIDGANDGASGVGILLEIARTINAFKTKPEVGVDILFFDGEDYGAPESFEGSHNNTYCLGSQYWAQHPHGNGYYGVLLDMVGAKNATFAMEGLSMQYAPSIVSKVWDTANRIGFSPYFIYKETGPITDDHAYVNEYAKIPMIDIIEHEESGGNYFGSYWHTHKDNINIIDKKTLKAVGQTLLEVVYNEKN